ncbi:glycosyltransferase [Marinilactibacillus psychrotolerans]|uniref:glycosyltransferase n=1 Tax=Marinilactibacillus psychrotolerans TaxID=191770 RepID=UPI00381B0607
MNTLRYKKYSKADKVITVSKAIEITLNRNFEIPNNKLTTIYNLFDIEEIRKVEPTELLEKNDFNILMVGRLEHQKGNWHAIDILSKIVEKGIKNVKLNIIGEGLLKSDLKNLAKKKNVLRHINFLGYKENVYEYMKSSDLFLMTSLYEGFPMVNVEALACGLPVVSVDCKSGPKELLSYDPTIQVNSWLVCEYGILFPEYGLVQKSHEISNKDSEINQMVADNIKSLIKDPSLISDLKVRSYQRALDFDKNNIAEEWIKILR